MRGEKNTLVLLQSVSELSDVGRALQSLLKNLRRIGNWLVKNTLRCLWILM